MVAIASGTLGIPTFHYLNYSQALFSVEVAGFWQGAILPNERGILEFLVVCREHEQTLLEEMNYDWIISFHKLMPRIPAPTYWGKSNLKG